MSQQSADDLQLLEELRRRRAELTDSMHAVEQALASAAGIGSEWRERVRAALLELVADLREHVAITEGPAGLYRELEVHAPRLAGSVDRLTREHGTIGEHVASLLVAVETDDDGHGDVERVRGIGTELLGVLMRHRQRGADLVFEAYAFDLGGET